MRDLVAAVGTLVLAGGLLGVYMGQGAPAVGVAAIGGCLVLGALRSRP